MLATTFNILRACSGSAAASASGWMTIDDVEVLLHDTQPATATTLRKYYYAGSQRIAMREGSGTGTSGLIWLLSDHLAPCAALQGCCASSTTVSVTAAGQVSEQRYTPWGEERYTSGGALPTSFRYTGQREEADLGSYYYGARWLLAPPQGIWPLRPGR